MSQPPISFQDAYALKEQEACLICARSLDRLNRRIEDIARDFDLQIGRAHV